MLDNLWDTEEKRLKKLREKLQAMTEEDLIAYGRSCRRLAAVRVVSYEPNPWIERLSFVLLLLLFIPSAAMPQRYGRPYNLAGIPQLLLRVSVQKKTHYFSVYDLRKMPRALVTGTDPITKQTHVYEGVALDQLAAINTLNSGSETVEIDFGSHQAQIISGNDLETQTKLIIVDEVDGKAISRYMPYDFVAEFRGKPTLTIINVRSISVRAS